MESKIRIWRTETRPSIDVEFWTKTAEDQQYMDSTYKDANLFLSEDYILSNDQLSVTRIQTWKRVPGIVSTLASDAMIQDQTARNIAYNTAHGITRTVSHYEIFDQAGTVLVTGTIVEY